jgi:hypothetical protein
MKQEESLVKDYLSRPARYANIDGINELTWGAMVSGWACLDWIHAAVPHGSLWHEHWVQVVYLPAWVLAVYLGGKALKRYVTYPRTGFVAYPVKPASRMAPAIAFVVAVATSFAFAALARSGHLQMNTIMMGVGQLVFYVFAARPWRPWKYAFLLLIAAVPLCVPDAHALLFYGLAFLASGSTTLTLYLRQTRSAE